MRITLLRNPKAGGGKHGRKELVKALEKAGHQTISRSTKKKGWRAALKKQADVVVVAGGDGAMAKVASALINREVPLAIKKAIEAAKKSLIRVPLIQNTVPHQLIGKFGAGRVLVKPASQGTGVIAGGAVRAVMQAVGVHDVRTKVLGSTNPHNVVRATFDALLRMKDPMELARLRGKQLEEI